MDEKFTAFYRVLDPQDNQTGGGSASAVAGAMAASLVGMVARVSVGKKNMTLPDETYQKIDAEAQVLSARLLEGSNRDSEAFDAVMQAYRLPKATDDEKAARRSAIDRAMLTATQTPLANATACADVLALAGQLKERSNTNAASDLECAVFLAQAGLRGALSNVAINLANLPELTAAPLHAQADALRQLLD